MDMMSKEDFFKRQISLSEWFRFSGFKKTEEFNAEDNEKRERLGLLNEVIGLPFDKPTQFLATDIIEKVPSFVDFLDERGEELCAIRLIPYDNKLPKIRLRGEKISKSVDWFFKQEIDPKLYKVDFVPHNEVSLWAAIVVINKNGIFGEVIADSHSHLTQGFYEKEKPIEFYYDFKKWKMSTENKNILNHLKTIVKKLKITDVKKKKELKDKFGAKFYHDYIGGYWETVCSEKFGLWFIDYNRILGEMYADFIPKIELKNSTKKTVIKGFPASSGVVTGVVKIIKADEIEKVTSIDKGTIIVCDVTTPDFVPLMKKCLAIVTDRGGILSHAAIVSRELNLPCIVATGKATSLLKDGMKIKVDADKGIVKIVL
jgi:phosphohistidine swiveling domain-containing protein